MRLSSMYSFVKKAVRRSAVAIALFTFCVALLSAGSGPSSFLHGIDVSRYQKEVDWKHVKESNINFAFVKATEGDFLKDPYFDRNWEHSRQHGIKRGAYHYYLPWVNVDQQIELFKKTVTLQPGDLAPVLDVETFAQDVPDAQMRNDIRLWLTSIEKHYGVKPIIYTYQKFYDLKLRGHFPGYHFWIARYQNEEPSTHPKDKMAFWQYSEKGIVKGIEAPVDVNWFYGDLEALSAYCVPAAKAAPTEALAQSN
ncbi:glycoside hydrolase family 25 protein [Rufibacter latericius]|uniref:Lysozyme n=1 Tax=Rufibacter latericius TaxID=2487040 RepID=A0A3M9MP19_9BACT|nr:GH25 family lysozyme [Rufibacter latericius]RNI26947.1 lysozyme [Rufibacter latericius]